MKKEKENEKDNLRSAMDRLHCERTTVYKLRARAVKKLCRLYFGVGE